jgi:hypothetical protein
MDSYGVKELQANRKNVVSAKLGRRDGSAPSKPESIRTPALSLKSEV